MGMAVGSSGGTKSDINVTPLIDVLLVLLIIFMVIAPIVPRGLESLIPQPAKPDQQSSAADTRTVVISVNKDRSLMINQTPIQESQLQSQLEEIFKTRAERVVFVKGDPDLEYAPVAHVIDIAHGAGIDRVGLMTDKIASGE